VFKINNQQVVGGRGAALTAQLTTISTSNPVTPNYTIVTNDSGSGSVYGFTTEDGILTVLTVIRNLQIRVAELETRLSAAAGHGLIANP
jgi:hypothetical protein